MTSPSFSFWRESKSGAWTSFFPSTLTFKIDRMQTFPQKYNHEIKKFQFPMHRNAAKAIHVTNTYITCQLVSATDGQIDGFLTAGARKCSKMPRNATTRAASASKRRPSVLGHHKTQPSDPRGATTNKPANGTPKTAAGPSMRASAADNLPTASPLLHPARPSSRIWRRGLSQASPDVVPSRPERLHSSRLPAS